MSIPELAQVGFALPLFIQVQDKDEVRCPPPRVLLPILCRGALVWFGGLKGRRSRGLTWGEVHGYVLVTIFSALTAALAPLAASPECSHGVCLGAAGIARPLRARKSDCAGCWSSPASESSCQAALCQSVLEREEVFCKGPTRDGKGRTPGLSVPAGLRTAALRGETRDPHWRGRIGIPVHRCK